MVLLASATVAEARFSPGFTTFFMPPSIGVVTKVDIATPEQVHLAGNHLRLAGATEILEVSALTGRGIAARWRRPPRARLTGAPSPRRFSPHRRRCAS